MKNLRNKVKRTFGGKTDNFTDKQEKAFEKAHLKAYLAGKEYFYYGFITNGIGNRERARHEVKSINNQNKTNL